MPALAALGAVHSAYVVLLRSLISLAIFLSVACSADRVFKVAVHLKHKLREMLTGKRPEHDFSCRPLPDPASYALVFPKVSWRENWSVGGNGFVLAIRKKEEH